MRPLRVATLHSKKDRSFLTRCHEPLSWLKQQSAVEWLPPMKAWEADVVVMHRQWQAGALAVVRSLMRNGIRVVVDLDEELQAAQPRMRQLCEAADAVTVANGYLALRLGISDSKIAMCPSGIDLSQWRKLPAPKPRERARTVGFAATASHSANLEILRAALPKLAQKFKEQDVRFVCFGFRPAWLSGVMPGAEMIEACRAEEYPLRLVRLGLDVALAPLTSDASNQNRSSLKVCEYAMAGAVTVATNAEPYAGAIQDGLSGMLVDNKADSWIIAVSKLIRNHDLRQQLLDGARKAAEAHDLSVTASRFLQALENTKPNRSREFFAFPRTQSEERKDVDVVIPIYNAPELTRQAIEATLPDLNANHRLILVDDASPDPAMIPLLDEYRGRPWVTVHRSSENRGFVGTCNLAALELARPDADVILLNSDARPMRGFIRRLAETAGSNPEIGTVTAVSNNGSIASVLDLSDADRLAAEVENPLVLVPTSVGHLMYVKREVIREFGLFDMAFSPGYGEENDLSLRISERYANVVDTGCWCWHKGSASFQETNNQLKQDHQALLDKRYPHYQFEVQAYWAADPLRAYRRRTLAATRDPRPRVLHVAHSYEGIGGTEKHIKDLEGALSDQFMNFVAAPKDDLKVYSGAIALDARPYVQANWPLSSSEVPANDEEWADILRELKPDLIHFHHLLNHPLSLLSKLADTGIPVVVSTHDYYFLCPDYTLQHCPGVHSCDSCFPERFKGPAEYQRLRRILLGGSLRKAAAIVAPSEATAKLVREVYPDLNIRVVPHGIRAVPRIEKQPGKKVRFGMIGHVAPVKGIELILKAWPQVDSREAELHLYGTADPRYIEQCAAAGIRYHGPYRESDLPRILSEIDIGLLPSQAPETFCYALAEFFSGGIPVIGSDYGNLADQIVNGVNGYKVPRDDPRAWVEMISLLIQDPSRREQIAKGVRPPNSVREMAAQYAQLYSEVLRGADDRVSSSAILQNA
jgi:glycosyltransferase involved in cell wall biosynthesis/GT2 family glycosyltransferase